MKTRSESTEQYRLAIIEEVREIDTKVGQVNEKVDQITHSVQELKVILVGNNDFHQKGIIAEHQEMYRGFVDDRKRAVEISSAISRLEKTASTVEEWKRNLKVFYAVLSFMGLNTLIGVIQIATFVWTNFISKTIK